MGTDGSRRGFTLIELIVTLTILVVVLGMAYKILENCLRTEQWVERESLPEKVGSGIIALLRRDIEGAIWKYLGTDQVFQVIDGGTGDGARDEIQLFTTTERTPLEDFDIRQSGAEGPERHGISAVSYFLRENNKGYYTLFRRESIGPGVEGGDPFQGTAGINYEIYDKVRSLNILCFDEQTDLESGLSPWMEGWDSRQRILLAQEEEQAAAEEQSGVTKVTGSVGGASQQQEESMAAEETVLPPAAIPTAVRVEIAIYVGNERGIFKNSDGSPVAPKIFSAVIPIFAAQRIPLTSEEDLAGTESLDGESGPGGSNLPSITGSNKSGGDSAGTKKPAKTR